MFSDLVAFGTYLVRVTALSSSNLNASQTITVQTLPEGK